MDILLKAFSDKPFSYDGEFYKFGETHVFPTPVQDPHPPIYVVGQSIESIEATVRCGLNVVSGGFGVPIQRLREFRKGFDAINVDPAVKSKVRISTHRPVYVTEDESELSAIVEQARWNMRVTLSLRAGLERVDHDGKAIALPMENEPTEQELLDNYFVMGSPKRCIEKLQELQDAMGITHFNTSCWFGDVPREKVLNSMRLFAEEIMPAFR